MKRLARDGLWAVVGLGIHAFVTFYLVARKVCRRG